MPKSASPFPSPPAPPSSGSYDSASEKHSRRASSLSTKAGQRLQAIFSSSPKQRDGVPSTVPAPGSPTINPASLASPTVSLSTAVSEKYRYDENNTVVPALAPQTPAELQRLRRVHAQFGPLTSPKYKYAAKQTNGELPDPVDDEPHSFYLVTTYISYLILILIGHIRDFFGKRFKPQAYKHLSEQNGYAPLNNDYDNFYIRRLWTRVNECFGVVTTGVPGRNIVHVDRYTEDYNVTWKYSGTKTETLNLGSYNYLGFAQSEGPVADAVEISIRKNGTTVASSRSDAGTTDLHVEAEQFIAEFTGKEAAILFSMGYATNAAGFPALAGKGSLIISDELNHASSRTGIRLSGASVRMFKHNDMKDLERIIRDSIAQGQPRTHRPWKKILIVVEGLYSMEGTMCNLPALVRLKKRYKCYLYVDEAHSIGALGPRGRGVCDYFGIDPAEVDILMGTLTKSFGANGGYLAGNRDLVNKLQTLNAGTLFGESPSPPVVQQIITSMRVINGEVIAGQGEERLQRLAFNTRYVRLGLKRLGFIVSGHDDSPIIPVLLYHPGKIKAVSGFMRRRKISVVVVGYPGVPLLLARVRLCMSAAHTKEDCDRVLTAFDELGDVLKFRYSTGIAGGLDLSPEEAAAYDAARLAGKPPVKPASPPRWKLADVLARGVADVQQPLR